MENLHLVTEWNDNGMECNANGIEWNRMEWNGKKSFVQNRCKICQKRSPGLSKFECGSLAIRGRRSVTRQILTFLGASARPTWERSLEGFLEGLLEGRLRGNMPKNMRKSRKIVPRTSEIKPWGFQNRVGRPPRRYFKKTFNLRRLKSRYLARF